MTKDQEIAELKAQVNALKDAISEIQVDRIEEYDYRGYSYCNGCDSNLDKQDHSLDCPFKVAKQTPQQCLADHNEALLNDLAKYINSHELTKHGGSVGDALWAMGDFIKDLKNEST